MKFTFEENQETVVQLNPSFWLPRPAPCQKLPEDLEEHWVAERFVPGIRLAFVKTGGEVHAYRDKQCLDNWEFARMCIEVIKKFPEDDILIDGVLKPDGGVLACVQGDRLGTYFAFDYVSLYDMGLPYAYRKKDLDKIGMMPETQVIPAREIESPEDLDSFFWTCKSFGDIGVIIKRKDSTYEVNDKGEKPVDCWQRIP